MCQGKIGRAVPSPLLSRPPGKNREWKKGRGQDLDHVDFSNNSNRRLLPFASGVSNNSRGSVTTARFVVSRARFMAVGPRFVR